MSFIYSQALVEASLPASCLDTEPSAQLSGSPTPRPCLWHDKTMEPSRLFRFGMTCRPLMDDHGAALLTSFVADFRAKTYQSPEKAQELTGREAECGTTWPASLAKYDPDTHSLKTAQHSLIEDLTGCSVTLPRSGLMRDGWCSELTIVAHHTNGKESGFWRTPSANVIEAKSTVLKLTGRTPQDPQVGLADQVMAAERGMWPTPTRDSATERTTRYAQGGMPLTMAVSLHPTPTVCGNYNRANTDDRLDYSVECQGFQPGQTTPPMRLNPDWVEWLMGWPIGHTALKPLEMAKFQGWQQQHSICLEAAE